MYSTSSAYKTEIKKPSRSFECKITIGDRIYNNSDIVNVVIDGNIQPSDGFMIGTTVSKTLDLTLINSGDIIYSTSQVKVEIGLKIGQTIEYIPMGLFNIDDIEKTDYTTKITAFDNMIKFESAYFSSLGDNPTLTQVVNELATKTGVQFTGGLPSYTVKKLEGFTCREIVGYVASICGGNAVITRDGKFTIVIPADVSLSIDGSNYINYKREEVKYKVGKVTCKVGEEELSKGTLGTDSMELGFENPWITNNILQDIYNKLNGFNYLGYSMKWQGDLSLDVGDIVTVTDVKGVVRKHPVLSQKFNYTGGLTAEIGAKGENKNKNSFSSSGDTSKKLNRMVTEVAIINKAFIDYAHINDADIVNLKAETAKIRLVEADVATINTVLAGTVNAVNINADNISAATGRIAILESGSATISQLNAANAKIATLESRAGVIDTLLAGNLTADNMKANLITAGTTLIADGSIASAKIISLSADKINAGKINTNLVSIQSSSGNMLISDNTIQIKDSSRVRVQIGKDASNDYNMYVWDSSGNLMFDATGLKASGIKTKIIRDDMVSDTANINATKIEKESLVTRINGATTLLLASKVKLVTENQTLEVAFNSLKSTVTTTANTVTSQGTSISTIQGQIQAKIWQQDITSATNSLDTRISSTETSITALNSAISLKVSTSDFTTYQSTVTSGLNSKANQSALNTTNVNVSSLTTRVTSAESSISVLQNQISLKVEQSDITTAINNVSIGVRNLVLNSSYKKTQTATSSYGSETFNTIINNIRDGSFDYLIGQNITYSFEVSAIGEYDTQGTGGTLDRFGGHGSIVWMNDNYTASTTTYPTILTNMQGRNGRVSATTKLVAPSGYPHLVTVTVNFQYSSRPKTPNTNIWILARPKLEIGDKRTDWSPAPEDQVSYTDTQISTAKAEIKITTDSISSTVNSVQSSVTSLGTRVTNAESSITSLNNSITLKVNTSDFNSYKTSNDSAVNSKASQTALNTTNGNLISLTTRMSTAESSISVLQGQITSKVWQQDITTSINDQRTMVKLNGIEMLNLEYRANLNTVNKPFAMGNYSIVSATEVGGNTNEQNYIKIVNGQFLYTPYIAFSTNSQYFKISLYNQTTNIGTLYVQCCYYDKDKVAVATNEAALNFSSLSNVTNTAADTWNTYEGYIDALTSTDIRQKAVYMRIRVLPRYAGQTGTSYIKDLSWKLLAPQVFASAEARISTAESTITQLSSSIALKVETSTYNTKMSSLDGAITSLNSRVSAAELKITDSSIVSTVRTSTAYTNDLAAKANQSALTTTNTNVSNLTTRVTNTEASITQLSSSITASINSITANYATKSEISLSTTALELKFTASGGYNLLKNSKFANNNYDNWRFYGSARQWGATESEKENGDFFYWVPGQNDTGGFIQDSIPIKPNTKYTLSLGFYREEMVKGGNCFITFCTDKACTNIVGKVDLALSSLNSRQSFTFTSPNNSNIAYAQCAFTHEGFNNNIGFIRIRINKPCLMEGEIAVWSPNPFEVMDGNTLIDGSGVTINNGAIRIRNNAGVEVLKGDTNGNLSIRGDFTNYDASTGNIAIRITNRTIDFNDWDSNSICGTIFAGKLVGQTSTRGMSFGAKRNKYLDIAYEDTDGNFAAAIRLDNGALGTTGKAHIYGGGSANFTSLYVSGSKNCIQDTENYGKRLLYAYETTESYLGDFVHGKIDENGECVISIDEIFGECVNTDIQYHVFTQTYKGSIIEIELYPNYFIVKGEAGTFFSCEIKAKRKGFEHVRLEQKFVERQGAESIEDELKQVLSTDIEEELYGDLADELLEV